MLTESDIFHADVANLSMIRAKDAGGSVWVFPQSADTYHPSDRCGEPYGVPFIARDSWGRRLFLFAHVDSHFPVYFFVFGDSFQDAFEWFAEDQEEYLRIPDEWLSDYNPDEITYSPNGVPIDTDNVVAVEVEPIEFTAEDGE